MTELTFLVELLLNHRLQKPTKDAVATRIKEVEAAIAQLPPQSPLRPMPAPAVVSSRDVAARHPEVVPVVAVAQTPAASAALASRQQAINESLAGKINKDTGRPRKF